MFIIRSQFLPDSVGWLVIFHNHSHAKTNYSILFPNIVCNIYMNLSKRPKPPDILVITFSEVSFSCQKEGINGASEYM